MCPPTDDDLKTLLHVIITSDDIWDPTVLDHSIFPSNDTYHDAMDPHIDTSMTGNYLHHDDYGPDYVCDVYRNECVIHSGFHLNKTNNSYCLSPQHMIKDQDYEALCPYLLWLSIDHIQHLKLLLPSGFAMHIVSHSTNILNPTSQLPLFPIAITHYYQNYVL